MQHYACVQRQLNHSGVGGGTALRRVYQAQAYVTLVMLFELVTRAPYTLLCISHVFASAVLKAMGWCPRHR